MGKKLCDMSLSELWELFPIFLTEHRACWKQWYEEERRRLYALLPARAVARISHIGSTAVDTIRAKPIVDILVEIKDMDLRDAAQCLIDNGYLCMSQSELHIALNKGYTEHGYAERVFHLHVRYVGDHDELFFRDYLCSFPEIAEQYEALKLVLWKRYEHNRDAYTEGKTNFVTKYTAAAKKLFADRY